MGQAIGTIIIVIIGLVVVAIVGGLILSVLGMVVPLFFLLLKLAIFCGLIYLGWLVFRRFTQDKTAD